MGDSAEGGLSTKVFSLETICLVQLPCFQVRCSLICCDNGGPRLIELQMLRNVFFMRICSKLRMDRVCVSKQWLWQRFYVIMFFCIYAFSVGNLSKSKGLLKQWNTLRPRLSASPFTTRNSVLSTLFLAPTKGRGALVLWLPAVGIWKGPGLTEPFCRSNEQMIPPLWPLPIAD